MSKFQNRKCFSLRTSQNFKIANVSHCEQVKITKSQMFLTANMSKFQNRKCFSLRTCQNFKIANVSHCEQVKFSKSQMFLTANKSKFQNRKHWSPQKFIAFKYMLAVLRTVNIANLTNSSPTLIYSTQTHTHSVSAQCTHVLTFRANAYSRMRGISFFLASFCFLCPVAKLVSLQFQKRSPNSYLEDASEDAVPPVPPPLLTRPLLPTPPGHLLPSASRTRQATPPSSQL